MRYEQYKFKFYLNASHAIIIRGRHGQTHPHTWEISIDTMKMRQDFIQFDQIERLIEHFIDGFQDTDLNASKTFETLNPTLENICIFFREKIEQILNENGWILLLIEVSETPARSYIINTAEEDSLQRQYAALEQNVARLNDENTVMHKAATDLLNLGSKFNRFTHTYKNPKKM